MSWDFFLCTWRDRGKVYRGWKRVRGGAEGSVHGFLRWGCLWGGWVSWRIVLEQVEAIPC